MPLYFNSFSNEIKRLENYRKRGGVYLRQKNGVKFPDNPKKRIHYLRADTLFRLQLNILQLTGKVCPFP